MTTTASVDPPGYPRDLVEVALLDDGTTLIVRPIRPQDADLLPGLHARLSAQSLYRRFMASVPTPPSRETLEHLTTVDYVDRLALVAEVAQAPAGTPLLVAVCRYECLPDPPGTAEVALVVADDWQRRGIGTRLLWRLSAAASARGVTWFAATVLGENRPMMGLLRELGDELESDLDGGVFEVRLRLRNRPP